MANSKEPHVLKLAFWMWFNRKKYNQWLASKHQELIDAYTHDVNAILEMMKEQIKQDASRTSKAQD